MRFEPNRNLDHSASEDIAKRIAVTLSDFDNDFISTVTLMITDGDIPTIDAIPSVTLSETNLSDGSAPSGSGGQLKLLLSPIKVMMWSALH